jgi:uncharacterized protein involved in type VI secretion and phage assembly
MHYSEEYKGDHALIDSVSRAYKEDIEKFDYSFEDKPKGKSSFSNLLKGFTKKNKRKAEEDPIEKNDDKEVSSGASTTSNKPRTTEIGSKTTTTSVDEKLDLKSSGKDSDRTSSSASSKGASEE